MEIKPFIINVSIQDISDLKTKLKLTRFPDAGPPPYNGKWGAGSPLDVMKQVHSYWIHKYDWRKHEQVLNKFNNFTCELDANHDSLKLHFIHQKSKSDSSAQNLPILLLHGWPGSVWEFSKLIPMLTRAGFDVVAPSLPGYGFSEAPKTQGWNPARIASAMNYLMLGLGYKRYYAQGGDWGSMICKNLGSHFTSNCAALHVNMVAARPPNGIKVHDAVKSMSEEDLKKIQRIRHMQRYEFGYQEIQGTKPQSLGYGLSDSPMALAAWIIEKFSTWGDTRPDKDPLRVFSMDDLLTNVSIYWFNNVGPSSTRLYYEDYNTRGSALKGTAVMKVTVPTAVAEFPCEIFTPPESWVRDQYNVKRWTKFDKGGHFAALEQPELLGKDIIQFFESLPVSKM